jgi:copper chaperone CopZ
MEKFTLKLPAMYGDHHVIEVRRILLELSGVNDVYASSCFQMVEVTYDPALTDSHTITQVLQEAGYMEDLVVPSENVFRHTTAYPQTGKTISFSQQIAQNRHAVVPCPGLGLLKNGSSD